ncbi:serine/threonine-protein phosphatase 2A activator 1 [Trichomonascus vanleenenianus]|uniref:peptidylprolyl isomerase RRD1 n=1 Tax=Trichomonascus vanleenenianus TaxID=2268995 RepID=UPI003EC9AA16
MEELRGEIRKGGFSAPEKVINDSSDMPNFHRSLTYSRIQELVKQVSLLVSCKKIPKKAEDPNVEGLVRVLRGLVDLVDDTPPEKGPRRFGNIAFRTWHSKLEAAGVGLIKESISVEGSITDESVFVELIPYFMFAFGSSKRLDFGTGHELSFLAFVGGLLYSEVLPSTVSGEDVLFIFYNYFKVVCKLVMTYNLEPAGSHGVWGLDDHFHLPYILGSAQLADITQPDTPTPRTPPKMVLRKQYMEDLSGENLYFAAINFINQMKRGPFHEHSPILYDVTAVPTWHKIHRGMVKMYVAEVLGKFPVVQHFVFGNVFYPWKDQENNALPRSSPREEDSGPAGYLQMPRPTTIPTTIPANVPRTFIHR